MMSIKEALLNYQVNEETAQTIETLIEGFDISQTGDLCWETLIANPFIHDLPFEAHQYLYQQIYAQQEQPGPMWFPNFQSMSESNLALFIQALGLDDYDALFKWAADHREAFWEKAIHTVNIKFKTAYSSILQQTSPESPPKWLVNAKMNIADSCFKASESMTAITYQALDGEIKKVTYGELNSLSNQVANSILSTGFSPGDNLAIIMPMTVEAIAIYLGIIKAECCVVSIADSFSEDEIATRLKIANAKGIFTQYHVSWGSKQFDLYDKILKVTPPKCIIINSLNKDLRAGDVHWEKFLSPNKVFTSFSSSPHDMTNVLFSSGTTGTPKAIPWDHTSPIKAAVDGYFHQDISMGDVVAWPTNLGWMMGPWLIYATLINQGTIALYYGAPNTLEFCQFIEKANVSILGVIPSLVKIWREKQYLEKVCWKNIKCYTSTGEPSNPDDMFYLSAITGYKPIIEYCGGTEISGAYISSTLLHPNVPSCFTTPTLGLDFTLLEQSGDQGEVAIIPPSIGLSRTLLNQDHFSVYHEGMPISNNGLPLRRHGDYLQQLANNLYRALGRTDDTMNIGGIKISSAEIERVINLCPNILETAAISAASNGQGPEGIVVFFVSSNTDISDKAVQSSMQDLINKKLNPLFKIYAVSQIDALPRTNSNKVMRRELRRKFYNEQKDT